MNDINKLEKVNLSNNNSENENNNDNIIPQCVQLQKILYNIDNKNKNEDE